MYMHQKKKRHISEQATKHGLKWPKIQQKTIKIWHFEGYYSALGHGGEKRKRKADHRRRRILKMKATADSQKDERKQQVKNYMTDRVGEGNYIHLYVHYTGCNHAASLSGPMMVGLDGPLCRYHPWYSIKLSVHGVQLHALFKATVQFRFLHWTSRKSGKMKPSNQRLVKQTGVANQSVICLCLEVQREKRRADWRCCNPNLTLLLNNAFI